MAATISLSHCFCLTHTCLQALQPCADLCVLQAASSRSRGSRDSRAGLWRNLGQWKAVASAKVANLMASQRSAAVCSADEAEAARGAVGWRSPTSAPAAKSTSGEPLCPAGTVLTCLPGVSAAVQRGCERACLGQLANHL